MAIDIVRIPLDRGDWEEWASALINNDESFITYYGEGSETALNYQEFCTNELAGLYPVDYDYDTKELICHKVI